MPRKIWIAVIALLLAAAAIPSALFATQSQTGTEARINAYKHEDGRIEFGMQLREGDGWGERILPRGRFLAADVREGRWLSSTPVRLPGGETPPSLPISTAATVSWEQTIYYIGDGQRRDFTNRGSFSAGIEESYAGRIFNTWVDLQGRTSHDDITSISLTFFCTPGGSYRSSDLVGSGGYIEMWDAASSYDGHEFAYDYSKGAQFAAQVVDWSPDSQSSPVVLAEKKWSARSTFIDEDLISELKQYTDLYITLWDLRGEAFLTHFPIGMGLSTPVQPNIDHCEE